MILSTLLGLAVVGQTLLPGSRFSLETAKEEARLIVVAEIRENYYIVGMGANAFGGYTRVKPSTVLKGKTTEQELNQYPLTVGAAGRETLPKVGEEYIIFLAEFRGRLVMSKLMAKTEQNIEAVRAAGTPRVPRPKEISPTGPGRSDSR